jgi:GNAT superfamily N-acetyltransferase
MFAFLYSLWIASRRRPFRLRDGRRIVVRDIAASDRGGLRAFFASLSPRTRQQRFHGAVGEVPEPLLDHLMRTGARARSLVATVQDGGHEALIAEARFAPADDLSTPEGAEFALVISDEVRGQGLGRHLLEMLMHAAAAAGYARVAGDVLADNRSMLSLAESLGFAVCRHPDDARLLRVVRRVSTLAPAPMAPRLPALREPVRTSA